MDILFLGNVVVELGGFIIAGTGSILAPIVVMVRGLLLFFYAFAEVVVDALLLNIVSRQIVVFLYLTASAFFS